LKQLHANLDGNEITEWMAFDRTGNPDWIKNYQYEQEIEKSKQMTAKEQVEAFKRMLGGRMKK
jgi:hypothetical protein